MFYTRSTRVLYILIVLLFNTFTFQRLVFEEKKKPLLLEIKFDT